MSAFATFFRAEFFQAEWAERIGWTLMHSLWQIALLSGVYASATTLLRNRTAAARYVVGCATLLAMLGLPVVTYVLLPRDAELTTVGVNPTLVAITPPIESTELPAWEDIPAEPGMLPVEPSTMPLEPVESNAVATSATGDSFLFDLSSVLRPYLPWATAAWLVGVLLLSLRPLWGWLHVRRLQRHGLAPLADSLQQVGERLMRRLGVRRAVRFARSALVDVPTVVGYLRPLVLLPASAITGLSTSQLEMILAHELAHVRRHDYLVNLVQTVIEALLFYHPSMWWVSGQIRRERENCCDDIAISICGDRANYVQALARLEEQRSTAPAAVLTATGGSLLMRVRRLLGQPQRELGYRNTTAWLAGLLTIGLVAVALAMNVPSQESAEDSTNATPNLDELSDAIADYTVRLRLGYAGREGGAIDVASGRVVRPPLQVLSKPKSNDWQLSLDPEKWRVWFDENGQGDFYNDLDCGAGLSAVRGARIMALSGANWEEVDWREGESKPPRKGVTSWEALEAIPNSQLIMQLREHEPNQICSIGAKDFFAVLTKEGRLAVGRILSIDPKKQYEMQIELRHRGAVGQEDKSAKRSMSDEATRKKLIGRWVGGGGIAPIHHIFHADGLYDRILLPGHKEWTGMMWRLDGEHLIYIVAGKETRNRIEWHGPDAFRFYTQDGQSWTYRRIDEQTGRVLLWGDPVEGLSVRLRPKQQTISKNKLAELFIDVHNQGPKPKSVLRAPDGLWLEVDGKWYRRAVMEAGTVSTHEFKPGDSEKAFLKITLQAGENADWIGGHARTDGKVPSPITHETRKPDRPLILTPGKHKIRLALAPQPPNDKRRGLAKLVYAYSNLAEIEVAKGSSNILSRTEAILGTMPMSQCFAGSQPENERAYGNKRSGSGNLPRNISPKIAHAKEELFLFLDTEKVTGNVSSNRGKAYKLFLVNRSEEDHELEVYASRLNLIQEAKDEQGNWQPVEYFPTEQDIKSTRYNAQLPRDKMWMFVIPRYEGTKKTTFRFKLNRKGQAPIYSKEFSGSINPTQFKLRKPTKRPEQTDTQNKASGEQSPWGKKSANGLQARLRRAPLPNDHRFAYGDTLLYEFIVRNTTDQPVDVVWLSNGWNPGIHDGQLDLVGMININGHAFDRKATLAPHTTQTLESIQYVVQPVDYAGHDSQRQLRIAPGKYQATASLAGVTSGPVEIEIVPERNEDASNIAWGKPQQGIRCAMSCEQTRLTKDGLFEVGFDVENRSQDSWVVQLTRPHVPHGIEWDGKLYRQVGSPRGERFTLEPKSRVNAAKLVIQLNDWFADKEKNRPPESPKLTPGRHTLRLAFYGQKFKGPVGSADYESVVVYSEPVEIEVVANDMVENVASTAEPAEKTTTVKNEATNPVAKRLLGHWVIDSRSSGYYLHTFADDGVYREEFAGPAEVGTWSFDEQNSELVWQIGDNREQAQLTWIDDDHIRLQYPDGKVWTYRRMKNVREVHLPPLQPGKPSVLDLASGKLLPAPADGGVMWHFTKQNQGDLFIDRLAGGQAFGGLRGSRAVFWVASTWGSIAGGYREGDVWQQSHWVPGKMLLTTGQGRQYEINLLRETADGSVDLRYFEVAPDPRAQKKHENPFLNKRFERAISAWSKHNGLGVSGNFDDFVKQTTEEIRRHDPDFLKATRYQALRYEAHEYDVEKARRTIDALIAQIEQDGAELSTLSRLAIDSYRHGPDDRDFPLIAHLLHAQLEAGKIRANNDLQQPPKRQGTRNNSTPKNGTVVEHWDNGKLRSEKVFADGKIETAVAYYQNGTPWYEISSESRQGATVPKDPAEVPIPHTGSVVEYWDDGSPKTERVYRDGKVTSAVQYAKNGTVLYEMEADEEDVGSESADVSLTGKVIGVDGKPAVGYRVTALCEAHAASTGWPPTVTTDENGRFTFQELPDGPCDVAATPNPKMNQPNMRIEDVLLKKGKPVEVTFSLEQKYSFSGKFTDAAGKPQPDRNVLAIWKDSKTGAKYSSNTKTDAEGHYRFASPFELTESVRINGGGSKDINVHQHVRSGRDDVDFRLTQKPVQENTFRVGGDHQQSGVIRGRIILDSEARGIPAKYVVLLEHERWRSNSGEIPNLDVSAGETFAFTNVPAGECSVRIMRNADKQQRPTVADEIDVTVKHKQTVELEFTTDGWQVASDSSKVIASRTNAEQAKVVGRIRKLGGRIDYHNNEITQVTLNSREVDDADLEHLKKLTNLESLTLKGSQITDAGLKHLKGLTQLSELNLYDTAISDAGLEHLKGLTRLKLLILKRTNVTNAGVKKLQQALPNCMISHSPRTVGKETDSKGATSSLEQWGEAAGGISLRLQPQHVQWNQRDDSPVFELDLRNEGTAYERIDSLDGAILEINGQKYLANRTSWEDRGNLRVPGDTTLEPFARFRFSRKHGLVDLLDDGKGGFTLRGMYALLPYDSETSQLNPGKFQLLPGKQTLRIGIPARENNLRGDLVSAYSNPVEIEIVAKQEKTSANNPEAFRRKTINALRKPIAGAKVRTIAHSAGGQWIAVANGNPTLIMQANGVSRVKDNWKPLAEIRNARTGEVIVSLPLATAEENAVIDATDRVSHFEVTALTFSPDGKVLAVGTSIGQVKLFNTQTGELIASLDDRRAKLADKQSPEHWRSLSRAMGSVASLAFSPDGSLLAVCGGSFGDYSDIFDGISQLGRTATGPGRLKVWTIKTGTIKHDLVGHSYANAVAFSPNGKLLASAGRWANAREDGTGVILWNPQTGAKIRSITNNANGGTRSVVFSPDSKLVAIGTLHFDKDKAKDARTSAINLVHVGSGMMEWKRSFPGLAKPVAFSSDGKSVEVLLDNQSTQHLETETGISWGKASNSVQCRLYADRLQFLEGETPVVRADVRNQGSRDLLMYTIPVNGWQIEVDGRWYRPAFRNTLLPQVLSAGGEHKDLELKFETLWRDQPNWVSADDEKTPLQWTPGKHSVRLAFFPYDPKDRGAVFRAETEPVEIEIVANREGQAEKNNHAQNLPHVFTYPSSKHDGVIRGRVVDPHPTTDSPKYHVMLWHKDWEFSSGRNPSLVVGAGEPFEFRGVAPGEYELRAREWRPNGRVVHFDRNWTYVKTQAKVKKGKAAEVQLTFGNNDSGRWNDTFTWGKAVDGVLMRITQSKFQIAPGEKIDLRVDLLNSGKTNRRIALEHESWELEIDGKWLPQGPDHSGERRYLPLAAGQTQSLEVSPWLYENMTKAIENLPPGKHALRIGRTLNQTQSTDDLPRIRIVSQPVEIEVVAGNKADATGARDVIKQ